MFNVAVFRLKDLIKYLLAIIGVIVIIFFARKQFSSTDKKDINIGKKISSNVSQYVKDAIEVEVPIVKQTDEQKSEEKPSDKETDENHQNKLFNKILSLELSAIDVRENIKSEENKTEDNKTTQEEKLELAKTDVKTEVTTKDPLADTYTRNYKGVKIKNETNFELSDNDLNTENLKINKSNIIIFHTHTCESYTSSEKYKYTPTGKFRTTDLNYSVARVGDELTKYLGKYNINVIHDKTYHDYPSYTGSYSRSNSTVSKLLKSTKADIIIDLHRDAIGSNSSYAPTVKIGNDVCAQIMFVMGTNGGGLDHPNWKTNLKFAVKMQEKANKTYPGLFKPILLRNSRYNQNLGKAACIIEVGATGNTLEQCLNSMKYLAEVINEF